MSEPGWETDDVCFYCGERDYPMVDTWMNVASPSPFTAKICKDATACEHRVHEPQGDAQGEEF